MMASAARARRAWDSRDRQILLQENGALNTSKPTLRCQIEARRSSKNMFCSIGVMGEGAKRGEKSKGSKRRKGTKSRRVKWVG